jgi:hypothetical protein
MAGTQAGKTNPLAWPFIALWAVLSFILRLTGRLVAGVLGLALIAAGVVLTLLVISAPLGIPLIALGFLLLLRSIF